MNITWKNCFKIGASIFILYLCIYYWSTVSGIFGIILSASTPIVLGFAIAYVLNILMSFYEKHYFTKFRNNSFIKKSKRIVCLLGSILTLLGIIALIVRLVVPELTSCVQFLVAEIPPLIEKTLDSEQIKELIPEDTLSQLTSINWMEYVTKFVDNFSSGLGNAVNIVINAVTKFVSGIVTTFISIIFSVYMLYGKNTLKNQSLKVINRYLPEKFNSKLMYVLSVLNDSFKKYIIGQCAEAIILGLLCTIGMLIFGFPYAGMIGALIGFTALIPIAGAYIGGAVGAIMMLTVSPIKAILFIIFIVVLQQIEGNLIYPKVVGKSLGLPAIWVLAAVTIGGSLLGILGMLIGVPITTAIYKLLREDVNKTKANPTKETIE